jgi:hypothetical protein
MLNINKVKKSLKNMFGFRLQYSYCLCPTREGCVLGIRTYVIRSSPVLSGVYCDLLCVGLFILGNRIVFISLA